MNKINKIHVHCTEDEKKQLEKQASKRGRKLSDYNHIGQKWNQRKRN